MRSAMTARRSACSRLSPRKGEVAGSTRRDDAAFVVDHCPRAAVHLADEVEAAACGRAVMNGAVASSTLRDIFSVGDELNGPIAQLQGAFNTGRRT
jgi:hypothetical protein